MNNQINHIRYFAEWKKAIAYDIQGRVVKVAHNVKSKYHAMAQWGL